MRKNYRKEFIRRGLIACGFGPMVLAIIYLILYTQGLMDTLTVPQVCLGIFSLSGLAFVAGGTNLIFQIEQIPLMTAIGVHGAVLYVSYLVVYLLNGWLKWGTPPILVFTGIFVLLYLLIWAVIYHTTKQRTAKLNQILQQNHADPEAPLR